MLVWKLFTTLSWLQSLSYVGMYYLRSEDGVVSIRLGEYSGDILQETEVGNSFVCVAFLLSSC